MKGVGLGKAWEELGSLALLREPSYCQTDFTLINTGLSIDIS